MTSKNKEFVDAFNAAYTKILKQIPINDALSKVISNFEFSKITKVRYLETMLGIKEKYPVTQTTNTTVGFQSTYNGKKCVYGFMYVENMPLQQPVNKYICIGGTFTSQDGEYRKRFALFDRIELFKTHFPQQYAMIENAFVNIMQQGDLSLDFDVYYRVDDTTTNHEDFAQQINESRIAVSLLVAAWASDCFHIANGSIENHINKNYLAVLSSIMYIYDDYVELCSTQYNVLKIATMLETDRPMKVLDKTSKMERAVMTQDRLAVNFIRTGQKLFPLNHDQMSDFLNIKNSIWKEHYINLICNDIVANNISPSFPIFNKVFIIQSATSKIFDNPTQRIHYTHGEIADDIIDDLQTTHDKTGDTAGDVYRPKSKKFGILSGMINNSIDYAHKEISMVNAVAAFHIEHAGVTFRDIIQQSRIGITIPQISYGLAFKDLDVFAGIMFELVYGLYCINSIHNIMHGDMHINNTTVNAVWAMKTDNYLRKVYSVIEGKDSHIYAFKSTGIYGTIIDFSRGILGDIGQIDNQFGETYRIDFFLHQRTQILNLIEFHFPDFYDSHEKTLNTIADSEDKRFKLFFKILTALDIYHNTRGLITMFEQNPDDIADGVLEIVKTLNTNASNIFLTQMTKLVKTTGKPFDIEWPNLTLIKLGFVNYKINKPVENITEVFRYNKSGGKYSLSNYDNYPEIIKAETYLDMFKKYSDNESIEKLTNYVEYEAFNEEDILEDLRKKINDKTGGDDVNPNAWMWE